MVSLPIEGRCDSCIKPVFKSPEIKEKFFMYFVQPLLVPILIKAKPPKIPERIPTVAHVIAISVPSVKPNLAKTEPTAAAVPCPPENPAARQRPKP